MDFCVKIEKWTTKTIKGRRGKFGAHKEIYSAAVLYIISTVYTRKALRFISYVAWSGEKMRNVVRSKQKKRCNAGQ